MIATNLVLGVLSVFLFIWVHAYVIVGSFEGVLCQGYWLRYNLVVCVMHTGVYGLN